MFKESRSLYFSPDARRKAKKTNDEGAEDLNLTMKNIKTYMEGKNKHLGVISPEIGHHIDKFEHLNDLTKPPKFDEDNAKEEKTGRRRNRKRKKEKDTIYT